MKAFLQKFSFILAIGLLIASCSDPIDPIFSYAPESPKAGQTVTFTNTTAEGEYWNWDFGDESKSVSKSPTHIYTKPGIYTVTLRVDSNDNYVSSKVLTVYDTVPSIYINKDSVHYYESVKFSVLAYNPYGYDVTYSWKFSNNAHSDSLRNNVSDDKTVTAYFTQRNVNEVVELTISVGDSIYHVADTFFIHDVPARSLLMTNTNGNILRQRLFDNGLEDYTTTAFPSGKHPFNIKASQNKLYVFDAGSSVGKVVSDFDAKAGDGEINVINMADSSEFQLVNNQGVSAEHGFFNGTVDGTYAYWTDFANFIYRSPKSNVLGSFIWNGNADAQTSVPYYLAKYDRLGYFGNGLDKDQMNGGIAVYDNAYFWAKGGSGKGIYRFVASDIKSANVTAPGLNPSLGSILTDYAIRAFEIDPINQMIYFSVTAPADKVGFWVARMNGTNAVRIDDAPMDDAALYITGIAVDNVSNYVYWAYRSPETLGKAAPGGVSWTSYYAENPTHQTGIKRTKLIKSYSPVFNVEYFAKGVSAYGIAIDDVAK